LIPDFILDALEGRDMVIYGDGDWKQSLCYITDMVDGLVRLMHAEPEISVVNLGHDQVYGMAEVAQKIIEMTNSTSNVVYEQALEFLTPKGIPDLRRAKGELDWIPLVGLVDGLERVIDYTIANKELFER
jgi:UDP-glucuronate decarboxylase